MKFLLRRRTAVLGLLALAQVFSPVLFVPGAEELGGSVFRVLLVLIAGILLVSQGFRPLSYWPQRALSVTGLLIATMTISLLWSPDLQGGLRQLSYAVTIGLLIYTLEVMIRDVDEFMGFAWMVAALGGITILLSFYELQSGNHFFRSSLQDIAESDRSLSYVSENQAWFTFGNPNDLVVHLTFCCVVAALFVRSKLSAIVIALYFAAVAYLAFALDARIAAVAMAVFVGIAVVAAFQRRATASATLVTSALVVGGVLLMVALAIVDRAEFLDVSTFVRLQLIWSAVEMSAETLLVGIGAGSFESEMWFEGFIGRTYGIVNPHNALARVFAENGVIGLGLLGYLMFGPVAVLAKTGQATRISAVVAGGTISLPLLFFIGSDPLSSSSLQLAIAFMWIACRFANELGGQAVLPQEAAHEALEEIQVRRSQA